MRERISNACGVILLTAAAILAGCVPSQTSSSDAQYIDAVQPGDQRVTCEDLRTRTAQMDGRIREVGRVEAPRRPDGGDAVGRTADGHVVLNGSILHTLVVTRPRGDGPRERGGQAAPRKEKLVTLYNQKDCRGPILPANS